jgi:peptidoglycan/LPS O-acetylase OafA/YrhL
MVAAVETNGRDDERSVGALLADLSEQTHRLVAAEFRLAMTEVHRKAKRAQRGAAMFGGATVFGFAGVGAVVAAAVLALALVLPGWLSALLVGGAALLVAGLCALVGRFQLRRATPPVPEWAVASVREDIDTIKRGIHR